MLTLTDKILRNQNTAFRILDGDGLIMDPETSFLHSLNEVACAIWDFISEKRQVEEIVGMLLEEFDCDLNMATQDTLTFLETLQEKGLIQVISSHDLST